MMKKSVKTKKQPRPVSDKVKEAHHGVIAATAIEEIAGAALLNGEIGKAVEMRDYRRVVELTRQAAAHYNRIDRATTSAMVQLNYDGMDSSQYEDDDDDL